MKDFEKIVTHMRTTGFVFQGSEIYGGLANTWDFGPLGIELKKNVKDLWWDAFVRKQPYNVGVDAAILMNPKVWEASGHLSTFNDPLMDCRQCKTRHRADKLIEEHDASINAGAMSMEEMGEYIQEEGITCPKCGSKDFTDIRQFNLMFKTFQGVIEDSANTVYLRPETAQGMFVNYRNVQRSMRKKLPFGIAQIGKSFRNEITPGNFIFRTREFEQMELEFFVKPGEDLKWYEYWKQYSMDFLEDLGLSKDNLIFREHDQEELSHYSVATVDIEYRYPWGYDELWGIADRTDFDLKQHQEHSKVSMEYHDPETNEKYVPYCVEPSLGVERLMLALMCEAYEEETLENGKIRKLMRFKPKVAPITVAVLPLSKKLNEEAQAVYAKLIEEGFVVDYDDAGSIGRRYRRQDEVGTPFCITYDFDSLDDNMVTIRERDSMEQKRVTLEEAHTIIREALKQ